FADQQLEFAFCDQLERFLDSSAHRVWHCGYGVEHETPHRGRFLEQPEQVERFGWSAGAPVENQVAERSETLQPLIQRRRADRVQDQIDAASSGEAVRLDGEVAGGIVDRVVRAVLFDE